MELLAGILVAWAMVDLIIMCGVVGAFFAFGGVRRYLWLGLFYASVAIFCLARAAHFLGLEGAHHFLCTRVLLASIALAGCSILCLALDREPLTGKAKPFLEISPRLVTAALVAISLFGPEVDRALPHGAVRAALSGPADGYRFTFWAYAVLLVSLLYAAVGAALLVRGTRNDPAAGKAYALGIGLLTILAAHDILVYAGVVTSVPLGEHGAFFLGLCVLFAFLRETELSRKELQASDQVLEQTSRHLDHAADESRKLRPMADLGRLAASLAQQIRSPLAAIGTVTVAMKRWEGGDDAAGRYQRLVDTLREETQQLARLVDDLLLYSGKGLKARGPVQIDDLVQAALGEARESIPPGSATDIVTEIEEGVGQLQGNAAGLRRALTNLIVNAVQSSGGKGRVEVVARKGEEPLDTVLIGVSDRGGGVPKELEEEIFEPYFTSRSTGTGLGLAVARRITEEHSGALLLDNHPGEGAWFWMKLPLGAPAEEGGSHAEEGENA
jgi:signal transduction histidine kinase